MLLTEIDHVAIAVADIGAAIEHYERIFGATVAHREVVEPDGIEEALLRVADSYIQLISPTRSDSTVARFLDFGPGEHEIKVRYRGEGVVRSVRSRTTVRVKN